MQLTLNSWYWLGSVMALVYGGIHVTHPHYLAASWGVKGGTWDPQTADFVRLLGVWILFQSMIAAVVPVYVKDFEVRYYITIAHVFKNLAAFLLRVGMWYSGRYDPIYRGFIVSTAADLIFAAGYGYFLIFPEAKHNAIHKR